MAGKPITRGSRRVAYVLDKLSKNTLADILLDRIGAEIGEDASDEQVFAHLQPWLDTVLRLRGDKSVNLAAVAKNLDGAEARYLEQQRQQQAKMAPQIEREWEMAAKIKQINMDRLKTHTVDGRPFTQE